MAGFDSSRCNIETSKMQKMLAWEQWSNSGPHSHKGTAKTTRVREREKRRSWHEKSDECIQIGLD